MFMPCNHFNIWIIATSPPKQSMIVRGSFQQKLLKFIPLWMRFGIKSIIVVHLVWMNNSSFKFDNQTRMMYFNVDLFSDQDRFVLVGICVSPASLSRCIPLPAFSSRRSPGFPGFPAVVSRIVLPVAWLPHPKRKEGQIIMIFDLAFLFWLRCLHNK